MQVSIKSVELVQGKELWAGWAKPMIIVHTDKGNFVSYGWMKGSFEARQGQSGVEVYTEPCKRVKTLTWIHLELKNERQ